MSGLLDSAHGVVTVLLVVIGGGTVISVLAAGLCMAAGRKRPKPPAG